MLSTYSYSSLDTYRTCPRKFKFTYVEKAPTRPGVTADTYLGTAVHRVLRQLYALAADGIVMEPGQVVGLYREQWDKLDRNQISVTSEFYTVDDYVRIGQEMLVRHYEKYRPFKRGTLLGAELLLTFGLPGTPYAFKSYIDRLTKLEDGTVEIVDYKTGQSLIQPSDPRFFYQMGLYQLAVQANYPQFNKVELSQHWLRQDEIISRTLSGEEVELLIEDMRVAIVETIRATRLDDFPAREGTHCSYCDYQHLCPAKAHRRLLEAQQQAETQQALTAEQIRQMADEYLKLYARQKEIKSELEALKANLIEVARQMDMSRFESAMGKISVRFSRKEKFVTKTDDPGAFAEFSAACRELGLDDYFVVDGNGLMRSVYSKRRLNDEQLEKLKNFVIEKEESRVTATLSNESEDDSD
ncbi:MAG: PD-(D/E)XK nuclease family protein [Candidatus Zixiibacteriota bacterium]